MTQKSLVYVVLAIAVGYMLVSAVPQQMTMYATPQRMQITDGGSLGVDSVPKIGEDGIPEGQDNSDLEILEIPGGGFEEPSFMELSRLPDLMKWWTLDVIIAISIYWIARRKLA